MSTPDELFTQALREAGVTNAPRRKITINWTCGNCQHVLATVGLDETPILPDECPECHEVVARKEE